MRTFFPFVLLLALLAGCSVSTSTGEETTSPGTDTPAEVSTPTTGNSGPQLDYSTSLETEWTVELSQKEGYKVGDNFTIHFQAKVIDPNWHIYSSIPSEEMAYTPTEFALFEDEAADIEKVGGMTENVAPKEEFDEIMEGTVRYFTEKEVTFSQEFKISGPNPVISGEVFGQICLDPEAGGQCKPLRLPFSYQFSAE